MRVWRLISKKYRPKGLFLLQVIFVLSLITACGGGGGGGDGDDTSAQVYVQGVAAVGAPINGALVTVRDSATPPVTSTAITDIDGTFTVNVTDRTPPFIVWATGDVNGEPVTLYSTCDSDGRVNVTPLTHLAMAMALGQDPAAYYSADEDAPAPAAAALDAAIQTIQTLFSDALTDLGVAADFDVMAGEFVADGTGLDALLDTITVTTEGAGFTITETETGEVLAQDDNVADTTEPEVVASDELRVRTSGLAAARAYFDQMELVFADGIVDADELAPATNWLAKDVLDRGMTGEQIDASYASGAVVRPPGIQFDQIELHRLMYGADEHPLGISEKGDYPLGFWCAHRVTERERSTKKFAGFVLDNGQWKFYGDRTPIDSWNTVVPLASKFVYNGGSSIVTSVQTGLNFSVYDTGMRGLANGVQKVIIANSALPAIDNPLGEGQINAVVLERSTVDISGEVFSITAPYPAEGPLFYSTDAGLDLDNLIGNEEFIHLALDASDQPIYAWATRIWDQPYQIPELYKVLDTYFPKLVSVGSTEPLSVLPLDQIVNGPRLSWETPTPEGIYSAGTKVEWRNWELVGEGQYQANLIQMETHHAPAFWDLTANYENWRSQDFNSPPGAWTQVVGRFSAWNNNASGQVFATGFQYGVGAPAHVIFDNHTPYLHYNTAEDGKQTYVGYIGLKNNGQSINPELISEIELVPIHDDGNMTTGTPVEINPPRFDEQYYYNINVSTVDDSGVSLPPSDTPNGAYSGFQINLPDDTVLPDADLFSFRMTVSDLTGGSYQISDYCLPPVQESVPIVQDLAYTWETNGDLTLSWTPPTLNPLPAPDFYLIEMWFLTSQSAEDYQMVLHVQLSNEALARSELTIPVNLVANIKLLKKQDNVAWSIRTRHLKLISESEVSEVAQGQTDYMVITGW